MSEDRQNQLGEDFQDAQESSPTASTHSVTQWLTALRNDESDAASRLFERFFAELVEAARRKFPATLRAASDEEDAAISALNSFFQAVKQGKFRDIDNRRDLACLLVVISERKAGEQWRREICLKRGGGKVVHASGLAGDGSQDAADPLENTPSPVATPEIVVQLKENLEQLLKRLDDPVLQQVVTMELCGCTVKEIADEVGLCERTIKRKRAAIRQIAQGL